MTESSPVSEGPVFALTPWSKRALALSIDVAPVLAIMFASSFLDNLFGISLFGFLAWVATLGYWAWQLYQQGISGQTIGKRLVNIKLVREVDAEVVGAPLSVARGFLHVIDALPFCVPIGYLNPLWDEKRQTFTDKILSTVVIDD